METEEDSEGVVISSFLARPVLVPVNVSREKHSRREREEKACSHCSTADKLTKKLVTLSYDRHTACKVSPNKLDHSSWNAFAIDGIMPKSAFCLSTIARSTIQKPLVPNKNGPLTKGTSPQSFVARRRRPSDLGFKRGKNEEAITPQFVFSSNYKKYIEAFRREKLLSLQKHLFEDEMKAKFEEIATTLAVRRSFLEDLPETTESLGDTPGFSNHYNRNDDIAISERMLTRSQTTIPLNGIHSEVSTQRQNVPGASGSQVTTSKALSHINLDLPANNQNFLTFQELQLKSVDNSKRGGLVIYQKSIPTQPQTSNSGPVTAQGTQIFAKQQQPAQQSPQQSQTPTSSATKQHANGRSSVAKVFDAASFILDRDLLKRKMSDQLRAAENAQSSTIKPLGRIGSDSKSDAPSPLTAPNGIGKSYSQTVSNPSLLLNSPADFTSLSQPTRLMTAGEGEAVASRVHAQLSGGGASTTSDSALSSSSGHHQSNGDQNFSDIKYWLMSVGGRQTNGSHVNGAITNGQPNLAAILKQQATELKSLQRQPSSNATSNDSASIPVKLKTFNAAEAIPPSAKPPKPKHWSLTAGGQRFLLGAVNISARSEENNANSANNGTGNTSNQPPVVAVFNSSPPNNNNSTSMITTSLTSNNNNNNYNNNNNNSNNNNKLNSVQSVSGFSATGEISPQVIPGTSLRLFSASNFRTKTEVAPELMPSAAMIANTVSLIGSAMQMNAAAAAAAAAAAQSKDRLLESKQNIANVIVDAINRRGRYQNPKRPDSKFTRKTSAKMPVDSNDRDIQVPLRFESSAADITQRHYQNHHNQGSMSTLTLGVNSHVANDRPV